ncbi:hypothetical protein ACVA51_24920 (plasmid) [Pseudomonas luteola]
MIVKKAMESIWAEVMELTGKTFETPSGGKVFQISEVTDDSITIPFEKSKLEIKNKSFEQTLKYLVANSHYGEEKKLKIGAHDVPQEASELCKAARLKSNGEYGPRVITYILPILAQCGVVEIDKAIPNTTWLKKE